MISFLLARMPTAKITAFLITLAQCFGWLSLSRAADVARPMPPSPELVMIRHALREFDRFLDHHPLIEDDLRLNPRLVNEENFLSRNSELKAFVQGNPAIRTALTTYPHYFLYRALMREASAPLRYADIAQLKDLLDREPALETTLAQHPAAIRDPSFLEAHADLKHFLEQHPSLENVFLVSQDTSPSKKP
jgi:hypothetical protein